MARGLEVGRRIKRELSDVSRDHGTWGIEFEGKLRDGCLIGCLSFARVDCGGGEGGSRGLVVVIGGGT